VVRPVAAERYRVQFTVDGDTFDKLRRVQDLMRHQVPDGDVAVIFGQALTLLLDRLERRKLAAVDRPRAPRGTARESRRIPAAVRRDVWARDSGQCAFVGVQGRCTERGFLEFHHVRPYADGGAATVVNIELRCRAHNQHEAERYFGSRQPDVVRERAEPLVWREYSVRTELSWSVGETYAFVSSTADEQTAVRALGRVECRTT
jgi:hypothetical protein